MATARNTAKTKALDATMSVIRAKGYVDFRKVILRGGPAGLRPSFGRNRLVSEAELRGVRASNRRQYWEKGKDRLPTRHTNPLRQAGSAARGPLVCAAVFIPALFRR